ncbi:MAG: 16S rRNA (cytosine(967)-C(5))-methyltransferase RsmB, partial [Gemmatimonadetes bacterium]|nr:16S rRNA (cytosine(967)-C(5))-methyltransferase RsmB [Gemmatimonadota bacterium]
MFLTSVPAHAAVNEAVRLARRRGGESASRFTNAILRRYLREGIPAGLPALEDDPVGHLVAEESCPRWLAERWVKRLGPETARARRVASNRTPPLALRVLAEGSREAAQQELRAREIRFAQSELHRDVLLLPGGTDPRTLESFTRGDVIVQDPSAALVTSMADPPERTTSLLDLCAAPGGKLIALASQSEVFGIVVGADRSPSRLKRLLENRARAELGRVHVLAMDALAPALNRRFQTVLLDAPCSGLGTMARHADLRWRIQPDDIPRLGRLAGSLLASAAELVEDGGLLLYSTCTTEPEENDDVIYDFLETRDDFARERPARPLPVGTVEESGTLRLVPEVHPGDGAFAVRLRKRSTP